MFQPPPFPASTRRRFAEYVRESRVIDPRLKFADLDDAEQILMNEGAPHARKMRRMAQRLQAGEVIAVESRHVQRLPGEPSEACDRQSPRQPIPDTGTACFSLKRGGLLA